MGIIRPLKCYFKRGFCTHLRSETGSAQEVHRPTPEFFITFAPRLDCAPSGVSCEATRAALPTTLSWRSASPRLSAPADAESRRDVLFSHSNDTPENACATRANRSYCSSSVNQFRSNTDAASYRARERKVVRTKPARRLPDRYRRRRSETRSLHDAEPGQPALRH